MWKKQAENTVRFVARGRVVRTVKLRAEETHEQAAIRAGIRLGSSNCPDQTVRLAEYGDLRGEARFA